MSAGLRHALPVATVVLFFAIAPGVALAGGRSTCHASACLVYSEPSVPTASGQSMTGGTTGGTTTPVAQLPSTLRSVLQRVPPKDRSTLGTIFGAGPQQGLREPSGSRVAAPSALGAAFDLGSGPTALLGILAATAVALALQGGFRAWRRRRPSA